MPLTIQTFCLGPWMTNCYVLHAANPAPGTACWIIDASFAPHQMVEYIRGMKLRPAAVVLTHTHLDHIAGLDELRTAFEDIPILVHPAEEAWLTDPVLNLSAMSDQPLVCPAATGLLREGETLKMAEVDFEIRHTPGHSPGGVSLYDRASKIVFAGDALFRESVGRTDLPGGNTELLMQSIRTQLFTLPDDTQVFPGHGEATTIGHEKRFNPFVSP